MRPKGKARQQQMAVENINAEEYLALPEKHSKMEKKQHKTGKDINGQKDIALPEKYSMKKKRKKAWVSAIFYVSSSFPRCFSVKLSLI